MKLSVINPETQEKYQVIVPQEYLQKEAVTPSMMGPGQVFSAQEIKEEGKVSGLI